jgi:hypothetical protein
MSPRNIAFTVILTAVIYMGASAQTSRRRGPIIRQVDHILIESSDPKNLFSFFADTLLFPEAWPIADNQGFISGGLGAGNVNIEFFRYAGQPNAPKRQTARARYAGFAFEPYPLSNSLQELQTAGIPYSSPESYVSTLPEGKQGVAWTTVTLPSFSKPGMSIFLYEYSPAFLKVDIRRKQLGNRLLLNGGGPLAIQSVREIAIEALNFEKSKLEWRQLLGAPTPSGSWQVGAGPAIRIFQGGADRIQGIIFKVGSIERAKSFLKKRQLLRSVSSREISLIPSKVQGLNIRLTE